MIAGLKWPPEMCANAVTISAIARPCASATPSSPAGADHDRAGPEEDQRERADELGRAAPQVVALHAREPRDEQPDGHPRPIDRYQKKFAEPVALSST